MENNFEESAKFAKKVVGTIALLLQTGKRSKIFPNVIEHYDSILMEAYNELYHDFLSMDIETKSQVRYFISFLLDRRNAIFNIDVVSFVLDERKMFLSKFYDDDK